MTTPSNEVGRMQVELQGQLQGQIQVKADPSPDPTKRLSSFKQPRDLMLKNFALNKPVNKKVFAPNLNVSRNKSKGPQISDNVRDRRKNEKHNGRDRLKGDLNKQSKIVKSSGVFSEGVASTNTRRYNTRESYSTGRESMDALSKPVYKPKIDKKIDKEFEDLKIRDFASDDDDADEHTDANLLPIRLPMNSDSGILNHLPELDITETKLVIKQEPGVKIEPVDDMMEHDILENSKTNIKLETKPTMNMKEVLKNPEMTILMLQFPDNLPGRGPDSEPHDKNKSDELQPEENVETGCKFQHLEEGQIGKIVLYKSGKIKFLIGNTHYDLDLGSQCCFRQDVMSISVDEKQKTAKMINLGNIKAKITAIPYWEKMFDEYNG